MWDKPPNLSAIGTARPLRVAYLIDPTDCPDALIDEIFSEAYSRWGGRRTLIVPASVDGVDTQYVKWLWFYDADVIYSFVNLSDAAVGNIHEHFTPAHLVRHDPYHRDKSDRGYYRIELPLKGLWSLSVIPMFLSRSWGYLEPVTNLRILDSYQSGSDGQFLKENFGFLRTSFESGVISQKFPDLFSCLTLISQEKLDDKHSGKDSKTQYEVDEGKILEALGQPGALLGLSQLSELFSPHLDMGGDGESDGLSLVAGDSVDDRLWFWNGHHRYREISFNEITSLRISANMLTDKPFLIRLKNIIKRRGKGDFHKDFITLRSCSIDLPELEKAAEILREQGGLLGVRVVRHNTHADCVPSFKNPDRVRTTYSMFRRDIDASETTEFKDNRVSVPMATPWYIRDALLPPGLRDGNWMIDLVIDRLADHCPYSNVRHTWVLPRRLRIEQAFTFERPGENEASFQAHFVRICRDGRMSVAHRIGQNASVITVPEDLNAFRTGLCNYLEWEAFDRSRKNAPQSLPRYYHVEPSDKGRYLLAVLGHFDTVPGAFDVLMNGYWRDVLLGLGAVPAEKNLDLREKLIRTLQKRLRATTGEFVIKNDGHWQRLAREAIRFGRMIQREPQYITHSKLKESWLPLVEELVDGKNPIESDDKEYKRVERDLDFSIQHLCQQEILFQGRGWLCRTCFNSNWITIDAIRRTLTCEVCGQEESAPVSGDWHFRANNFIIEAYRDHGVEAVIWTLWQLSKRAKESFYFAPSMQLWDEDPETDGAKLAAEFDALVVVDGKLYLCEAKSSDNLDKDEIDQLVSMGSKIRPDVLLISCMDRSPSTINSAAKTIQNRLGNDIHVEVISFNSENLKRRPWLPY